MRGCSLEANEDEPDPVRRDLLRHPVRRRIVDLLAQSPGLNKSRIARELGLQLNAVRYHLRKLEGAGLVVLRRSPRKHEVVSFVKTDARLWDEPRTRVLFGGRPGARVARHIARHPGATVREIAPATGLTPSAVHYHIRTLMAYRLVIRYRLGPVYRHYPHQDLERWASAVER